jgi:hypothetical protein
MQKNIKVEVEVENSLNQFIEFNINKENWGKSGIYIIKNIINNKSYIGSTNNLRSRYREYYIGFLKEKMHNIYLQRSIKKYGLE